jgi:hypothetical protein
MGQPQIVITQTAPISDKLVTTTGDMSAVSFDCYIKINTLGSRGLYVK